MLGGDRRAKLLTGATVIALIIAVGAFIALEPASEDAIPRDAYTVAADRLCVKAKRHIVAAERESFRRDDPGGLARSLVSIIDDWRTKFQSLAEPEDRLEQTQNLGVALLDVELRIATLARIADEGQRPRTVAQARRVDAASAEVEAAIAALGLTKCAALTIGFGDPSK